MDLGGARVGTGWKRGVNWGRGGGGEVERSGKFRGKTKQGREGQMPINV